MSPDIIFNEGSTIREYLFKQPISRGPYSTIFKGINKQTSQNVILKVVPFDKMKAIVKFNEFFNDEKDILLKCKNQNLVRLLEIVSYKSGEILVLQYCNGPTLEDIIQKKQKLPGRYASYIFKQILNAFMALKTINAMHRDFKAQHVYFHNDIVKIGGFSFSKVLKSYNITTDTSLGTAFTMAPQVLRGEYYGASVDIWSIGAVFFKMIYGKYPFRGKDDQEILKSIQTQKIQFEGTKILPVCKDFIEQCLKINPQQRLNWDTIQNHPFIIFLKQCDFKEFKKQSINEMFQNLRKNVQVQRQQTRKKMHNFEQRIKQLVLELAKQSYEVKSLRIRKQEDEKLIKSLEKQIENKNAKINHYQKLLYEKNNEAQQKGKLSEKLLERLNQEIHRFNDKILNSFFNKTPIQLVNLKTQSPRNDQQINRKTDKLYVIDGQNFNKLMQKIEEQRQSLDESDTANTDSTNVSQLRHNLKEQLLSNNQQMNLKTDKFYVIDEQKFNRLMQMNRQQKQSLNQSYITKTNSTEVSELRDNQDENIHGQAQLNKTKQIFMKSFEDPSQQNIHYSFKKKKQLQYQQQPMIIKADDLYFENDILKNEIQGLINIKKIIEGYSQQRIQLSTLVYKNSLGTKDLVPKIKEIFNPKNQKRGFLALFQTKDQTKFSIFCYKNGDNYKTVLVNLDRNEVFIPKKQNKIGGYSYRSSSQKIIFGTSQITLRNYPPQLQINLNVMGDKYFNIEKIEELTGSNENQVNLSEIQIYDIQFKK